MLSLLLYLNIPDLINKICLEYKFSTSRELKGSYTTVRVTHCGTFICRKNRQKHLNFCFIAESLFTGFVANKHTAFIFLFDTFMDIN